MISPSETTGPDVLAAFGVRSHQDAWSTGSVLPLEFEAIDHPLRRKTDWMFGADEDSRSQDGLLREQVATGEARLRTQAIQAMGQVAEARREAQLEARGQWELELEERIAKERDGVAQACAAFAKARGSYFASVEGEVVRLALAIAARVLHREAKLDPLLLGAVVRVALEKVAEDSGAVLHVPVADADAWRAVFAEETHLAVKVIGEDRMEGTECVLETSVGRVELGVVAQLEEIEKGFFDLLQQRPM
jgi:flagellar assembly protein FliH